MKLSPAHVTYAAAAYLTTLVLASPVAAATPEERTPLDLSPAEPAREAATGGGGGGLARMIVGLAVVIAVIYGLSWIMRQVKAAKEGQASGTGLAAISSLPLGPNRSVHLVRAGTDLVLLGAAEKGVTPIRTYTEQEARAAGLLGDEGLPALPSGEKGRTPLLLALVEAMRQRTVRK